MITFISSSQIKIKQFKFVFPEKTALYDNSVDLAEKYCIKNRKEFMEYKFSQIDESKYLNTIIIEDTIVRPLTGNFIFYNQIGKLIKKDGLCKTIKVLETYNPIYLVSCVLVKKGNCTYFIENEVLGNFKYHECNCNKQLEDYFFINYNGIQRRINMYETPRIQCFKEIKSLLLVK